jgi:hypothetical protein
MTWLDMFILFGDKLTRCVSTGVNWYSMDKFKWIVQEFDINRFNPAQTIDLARCNLSGGQHAILSIKGQQFLYLRFYNSQRSLVWMCQVHTFVPGCTGKWQAGTIFFGDNQCCLWMHMKSIDGEKSEELHFDEFGRARENMCTWSPKEESVWHDLVVFDTDTTTDHKTHLTTHYIDIIKLKAFSADVLYSSAAKVYLTEPFETKSVGDFDSYVAHGLRRMPTRSAHLL